MVQVVYLLGRGIAVESTVSTDGYNRFNQITDLFLKHYFYNKEVNDIRTKEFADYLFNEFEPFILNTNNESLITSDCPVQIFHQSQKKCVALIILPLTPKKAFVAYKKSEIQVKKKRLNDEDVSWMNTLQSKNCIDAVYSIDKFDEDMLFYARKGIKTKMNPKISLEENKIKYNFQEVDQLIGKLRFIKKTL